MGGGIAVGSSTAVSSSVVSSVVTAGGVALFVWALGTSRRCRAERLLPGFSEAFEVVLPSERTPVGRPLQFRLRGESRRQWAPGLLGVTRRAAAFVPSRPQDATHAWGGDVDYFEAGPVLGQGSYLRLHTPEGPVQFALHLPPRDLTARLAPLVPARPRGGPGVS